MTHLLRILTLANAAALTALPMLFGCAAPQDDSVPRNEATAGAGGKIGVGGNATGTGGSAAAQASAGASAAGAPAAVDPSCGLPDAAFCDPFNKASPGGRAGSLDDANWTFARLGNNCVSGFGFPPSPINVCGVWQTVDPGGPDSVFCKDENGDSHWAEGFHDNGGFAYLSARIRQPFDFADRMGTIQWEADARTSGTHGWWLETWITDEPVPGPLAHGTDQLVSSKEAVGIVIALNCAQSAAGLGTAGGGLVGVSQILLVHDHVQTDVFNPFDFYPYRCVTTQQGILNKFQFKVSTNRIEVWATDAGGTELERIAEADVNLSFSRGYVQMSHVHYNAHKAEVTSYQSYQWARAAFDGPRLPTPRAYEIPDPLTRVPEVGCDTTEFFRFAYGVTDNVVYDLSAGPGTPAKLVFTDVNPANGTSARLNFNTTFVAAGNILSYRMNGKQWHQYTVPAIQTTWERQGFSVPVPVGDLILGDNTVEFGTNSTALNMPANSMHIANIDLEIEAP